MSDRILVIDPDSEQRDRLLLALGSESYDVSGCAGWVEARSALAAADLAMVIADASTLTGSEHARTWLRASGDTRIVLLGERPELAETALSFGVHGCLPRPFSDSELSLAVAGAVEAYRRTRERHWLREELDRSLGEHAVVAASESMIGTLESLERAAMSDDAVVFRGEPGTGKEVLARALHAQSPRRGGPFVVAPCASDPDDFFGPGGFLARAAGGVLFLDRLDELPETALAELERRVRDAKTPGEAGADPVPIDVRILASSRDGRAPEAPASDSSSLRAQLHEHEINVPALRDRQRDIPLLVDLFLAEARAAVGKPVASIADDALERLVGYRWPGNVRELRNVIERCVIRAATDRIGVRDLPAEIASDPGVFGGDDDLGLRRGRRRLEADLIRRALRATSGNRAEAARRLEISPRALLYKIKEYAIRD